MSSKALAHPLGNVPILQSKKSGAPGVPADTGAVAIPVVLATPHELIQVASGAELLVPTPDGQLVLLRIPSPDEFLTQVGRDAERLEAAGEKCPPAPALEDVALLLAPLQLPE